MKTTYSQTIVNSRFSVIRKDRYNVFKFTCKLRVAGILQSFLKLKKIWNDIKHK